MLGMPSPIIAAGHWKRTGTTPRDIVLRVVEGWPEWVPGHDELLAAAIEARGRLLQRSIAHAFVGSLSNRHREWRVAFACFAASRFLEPHAPSRERYCDVCHAAFGQRIRWSNLARDLFDGGYPVTGDLPLFAFVMNAAADAHPPAPGPEQWDILRRILRTSLELLPNATGAQLVKAIARLFPGNAHERELLVKMLGKCGIWEPVGQPSVLDTPYWPGQEYLGHWRSDLGYPMNTWRARDGLNARAVRYWFPELAAEF